MPSPTSGGIRDGSRLRLRSRLLLFIWCCPVRCLPAVSRCRSGPSVNHVYVYVRVGYSIHGGTTDRGRTMRIMKRLQGGLLATAMLFAAVVVPAQAASAAEAKPAADGDTATINLLNVNDFHGRIDTGLTVPFASTVQQLKAEYPDSSLFLGAGDLIGASLFNSSVQKDQPTINVLNALGLKASSVGNHEFDQGYDDLANRVIGADGARNAKWDYLGANVYKKGTTTPALKEYSIQDVDGVKVGVIGAVTQETPTLVSPGGVKDLDFGDPVEAVNRVAEQLTDGDESNGEADVLVAEYHEGAPESENVETGKPTIDEQKTASPVFKHIVGDTDPSVDAIFNGHTHMAYSYTDTAHNNRPVIQTGNYAANVGQVVLDYHKQSGAVSYEKFGNVAAPSVPSGTSKADFDQQLADADKTGVTAKVKGIVDAAVAKGTEEGNKKVGSVDADITTAFADGKRDDRGSESTLGNLVADSLLDSLSSADRGGAQIGVVNPGGLRAELCKTGDNASCALAADGSVTYAQANAVLPFLNNLWTTTLTGAQFKEALEQQWQTTTDGTTPSRPYLQLGLSHNVSYTYDPNAKQGEHITSVTINGKPLDPKAEYRIGSFSFLLQGGDNFRAFAQGTNTKDTGLVDRDAWIDYISKNSPLKPRYDRRAVAVTGLPTDGKVKAGESFTLNFSKLTLTSLGVPAETKLTAKIGDAEVGSADVKDGDTAALTVTVPADAQAGAATLIVTGATDGTTVTLPLTVAAADQPQPTEPAIALADKDGNALKSLTLKPNDEKVVRAYVKGENVEGAPVYWKSSDPSVVSFKPKAGDRSAQNGKSRAASVGYDEQTLLAHKDGNVVIAVTAAVNGKELKAELPVAVRDGKVVKPALYFTDTNGKKITSLKLKKGASQKLWAVAEGKSVEGKPVYWKSSDPQTVSFAPKSAQNKPKSAAANAVAFNEQTLLAHKDGKATITITATIDGKALKAELPVTVGETAAAPVSSPASASAAQSGNNGLARTGSDPTMLIVVALIVLGVAGGAIHISRLRRY
ncbi:bifunctional metallophosphatase/5'-nucleotidase [Bifidobacterium sp. 82T24]|nr:bifunctional metallophosphatase/5'-nucleotidase [Bifidobacterium pluvialisilvae]